MEFGAKEIMIALGLLVVIAIVLDVLRRIKVARYNSIRMPRRKQPIFDDTPLDEYGSELPNGKARVVAYRDEGDLEQVGETIKQTVEKAKPKLSASRDEPEQGTLGFGESPDLFQELVSAAEQPNKKPKTPAKSAAASDAASSGAASSEETSSQASKSAAKQKQNTAAKQTQSEPVDKPTKEVAAPEKRSSTQMVSNKTASNKAVSKPAPAKQQSSASNAENLEANVMVLHVMSYKDQPFAGDKLKEMLLNVGLRYGSMKIFHRHESENGSGNVLFSVANSVNPGTFDLNGMENFSSPGVSLFFTMSDVEDPGQVFDLMLTTAQRIAAELGGNVADDARNILTRQMIEHYRQRLAEFARARLSSRS